MSSQLAPEPMVLNISSGGNTAPHATDDSSSSDSKLLNKTHPALKISLKTQSPVSRERAAISIQMSDPESILDKVLELLANRFPVQAFYQVLANQQQTVREVAASPTTNISPTGRAFASKVQSAMLSELVKISDEEGSPINSLSSQTMKTWLREALATLSASELEEVTTNVSPTNSSRLAQVLLERAQSHPPSLEQSATAAGTQSSLLMNERQSTASIITGVAAEPNLQAAGARTLGATATTTTTTTTTTSVASTNVQVPEIGDAGISTEPYSKPMIAVRRVSNSDRSGEPDDADSAGKWETVDDSVLLADRETERSNGANSHSSNFSAPISDTAPGSVSGLNPVHAMSTRTAPVAYSESAQSAHFTGSVDAAVNVPVGVPLHSLQEVDKTISTNVRRTEKIAFEGSYVQGQSNICGQRASAAQPEDSSSHKSSSHSEKASQHNLAPNSVGSVHSGSERCITSQHSRESHEAQQAYFVSSGTPTATAAVVVNQSASPSTLDQNTISSAKAAATHALQRKATIKLAAAAAEAAAEAAADKRLRTGQSLIITSRPTKAECRDDGYATSGQKFVTGEVTRSFYTSTEVSSTLPTVAQTVAGTTTVLSRGENVDTNRPMLSQSVAAQTTTSRFTPVMQQFSGFQLTPSNRLLVQQSVSQTSGQVYRIVAPPLLAPTQYADTRAMWLTMLERALRAEHEIIQSRCAARVTEILRQINVPCRGVGSVDSDAASRFIHQNPAICTRVVNSVRYLVSRAIKELCEELGFLTTDSWLSCPVLELLSADEQNRAFGSAIMVARALTESSASFAIQSFGDHLVTIQSANPASAELRDVLSYPTDAPNRRQPCASMANVIESRRRESLQTSLDLALDNFHWEEISAKPLLAFVQACYNRKARDLSGESIKELSSSTTIQHQHHQTLAA